MALARRGFLSRLFAAGSVAAAGTVLSSKAKASPPEIDACHLEAIQADLAFQAEQREKRFAGQYLPGAAEQEAIWKKALKKYADQKSESEKQLRAIQEWADTQRELQRRTEERDRFQRDTDHYNGRTWTDTGSGLNEAIARTYNREMFNAYQRTAERYWRGMSRQTGTTTR